MLGVKAKRYFRFGWQSIFAAALLVALAVNYAANPGSSDAQFLPIRESPRHGAEPAGSVCGETNGIVLCIGCVSTNLPGGVDLVVTYTLSNGSPKRLEFHKWRGGPLVGMGTEVRDTKNDQALKPSETAYVPENLANFRLSSYFPILKPGESWTEPINLSQDYVGVARSAYEVRVRCRLPAPEGEPFAPREKQVLLETPPLLIRTGCSLDELVRPHSALTNHENMTLWLHSDTTNCALGQSLPLDLYIVVTNGVGRSFCGNSFVPSQARRVFTYIVTEESTGRVLSSTLPEEDKVMSRIVRSGGRSIWPYTVDGVAGHGLARFSSDLEAEYHFTRPGWYSVQARLYVRHAENDREIQTVLTPPLRLFLGHPK